MKKFLVISGAAYELKDDPNIPPMVVANAIERCKQDGSDYFDPPIEHGEPKPEIEDDGSDHYYRLTKGRNFTIHEVEDLVKALL